MAGEGRKACLPWMEGALVQEALGWGTMPRGQCMGSKAAPLGPLLHRGKYLSKAGEATS